MIRIGVKAIENGLFFSMDRSSATPTTHPFHVGGFGKMIHDGYILAPFPKHGY